MADPLLTTDQVQCYDHRGAVIPCGHAGQDGGRNRSEKRVLSSEKRFRTENGAAIDTLTGQIWSPNANVAEYPLSWPEAHDFISELNKNGYLGFSNWQLPDRHALFSLISHQYVNPALPLHHPFENVFPGYYWSSESCSRLPDQAWYVHFGGGRVFRGMKHGAYLAWPTIPPAREETPRGKPPWEKTPKKKRFAVEAPLIFDHRQQTTWLLDHPHLSSPLTWREALDSVDQINREKAFGCHRWQLPNIRELECLVDLRAHTPALFHNPSLKDTPIQPGYWSSTTSVYEPRYAWVLYTRDGEVGVGFKQKSEFFGIARAQGLLR